jgi:hypothetical protein
MCARALAPSYQVPDLVAQSVPAPKSKSNTIVIVAVVIVIVLAIIAVIAVVMIGAAPKADLRADLSYSAANDWLGLSGSGTIIVYGTIYNYGDKMGDGTVQLHIYDGYEWHDYSSPTGVVPANGSVDFFWDAEFDMMDEDSVVVQHTITTG